jgi:hypothetical protein
MINNKETILDFQRSRLHGRSGVINRLWIFRNFLEETANDKFIDFEFIKLIPVAIVSAHEAFFKYTFRAYIDHNDEYLDRSFKLTGGKNEISLDFEILKDIKEKRVTIGEIFALSLKYSRPEIIEKNLNSLLFSEDQGKFYSRLKKISDHDLRDEKIKIPELTSFLNDPAKYIKAFNSVFDLRHKYIHEFMSSETLELDYGLELLTNNFIFLKAVDRMVWEDLYPDIPLTQAAMNESSAQELQVIERELVELNKHYLNELDTESEKEFRALEKKWKEVIHETAKFFADQSALGGSMHPMVLSSNLSILKKSLKDYLEDNQYILEK